MSKGFLIKKFTSPFNLIVLNNTKKFSNLFHVQTSLKKTIFPVKNTLVDIYFLSGIHFSLPLNTAVHWMGNTLTILCSQMLRTRRFSTSFYIFCKLSKITLEFISELINMNYSFNIPFKFSLKITRELFLNSMMVYSVKTFTQT